MSYGRAANPEMYFLCACLTQGSHFTSGCSASNYRIVNNYNTFAYNNFLYNRQFEPYFQFSLFLLR